MGGEVYGRRGALSTTTTTTTTTTMFIITLIAITTTNTSFSNNDCYSSRSPSGAPPSIRSFEFANY